MSESTIRQAYAAFNARDAAAALALMTPDVHWARASEGGAVVGKEEIRSYWTRQWREFDPHVEPLEITRDEEGRLRVRVHQVVKSIAGQILADGEVVHVFTLAGDLIRRMELDGEPGAGSGPSRAFANHS